MYQYEDIELYFECLYIIIIGLNIVLTTCMKIQMSYLDKHSIHISQI